MKKIFIIFSLVVFSFLLINKLAYAESGICPFDREINLGDENGAVRELQKFLSLDKKIYNGPVTGYFGPLTQKGVKAFQTTAGLLPSGGVDMATATVLCQIYLSYKASEPVNNNNDLAIGNACFLKTMDLEAGYYDSANEEVLKLQKWLADGGFYPEKRFTGYFGGLTKKAVQRFQKSQGIVQTGIVGAKTTAAICGNSIVADDAGMNSGSMDLTISVLDIAPQQIDVGTEIKILAKEKNISSERAGKHITSFYINDKEVLNTVINALGSGEEALSVNYDWKCPEKGIYIFKIFVDSGNELVETNKYNNVLVFPVNCGGVTKDLKYSCSTDTGKCEVDVTGSMTLGECTEKCKIGDKSLPDLLISEFSPTKIKINETLPLKIVEKNDGNSKAEKHAYAFTVAFGNEEKTKEGVFNELEAKETQEVSGQWTCSAAGVYTITIDIDPDNNIKESNKANNKKIFKIECAGADGVVPKEDPVTVQKQEQRQEESQEQVERQSSGGGDKPDLVMVLTPAKMDTGKNTIKYNIKNNSKVDITKPFYFLIERIDANGKVYWKDLQKAESFAAGAEGSDRLFVEDDVCDPKSPYKVRTTIDSTNTIDEKLENNNVAESICGEISSNAGSGTGTGTGTGTGSGTEKSSPCYSGPALIEIKSASAQIMKDSGGAEVKNNYIISYNITNIQGTKAEGINIGLFNGTKKVTSANISSLYGCKTYESATIYTCQGKESSIDLKITYDGNKSASKSIAVSCGDEQPSSAGIYCDIDRSINSNNEVRIAPGESIKYTLKIVGNTNAKISSGDIMSWTGVDNHDSTKINAYKKFSNADVGRRAVSGVFATYRFTNTSNNTQYLEEIKCPNVTAVVTANSSDSGKNPNLSSDTYCTADVDLNSNPYQVCFTNYIRDLNSKCTLKYNWESLDKSKYVIMNSGDLNKQTKCIEPPKSTKVTSAWTEGLFEALKSTASCAEDVYSSFSQSVTCKVKVFKGGSSGGGSSKGTISARCSASPITPKAGESVKFSSSVSTSEFNYGQCGTKTYSWSGCTSSSDTCSKTYGSNETGSKAVTVTVKCFDDSSKTASATCNINVASASAAPTPTTGSCTCNATKCSFGTSGSHLGYTCQWVMNNTALSSTTSRCVDIQKGGSTITQASVKVTKDSDGSVVFNGACTTGQ